VLTGLGLVFFGGEGLRSAAFSDVSFNVGVLQISTQSLLVIVASVLVMAGLWLFFGRSIYGKALRATAVNRVGARLVGIRPGLAGGLSLLLAAFIGALSGILISPITNHSITTRGSSSASRDSSARSSAAWRAIRWRWSVARARAAGGLRVLLVERLQGNAGLRHHHPAAHLALAALAACRGRRRGGRMIPARALLGAFIVFIAAAPFILPEFQSRC